PKFDELFNGQAGLRDDRLQRPRLQVSISVDGNGHRALGIVRIRKDVVIADCPVENESLSHQCFNNLATADGGQPSFGHTMRPRLSREFADAHLRGTLSRDRAYTHKLRGWLLRRCVE